MSNFNQQRKQIEKQRKQLAKQHRQKIAQNAKQFRKAQKSSSGLGALEISLIVFFGLGLLMVFLLFFLL